MMRIPFITGIFCLITNASGLKVTQPDIIVANRHGKAMLVCDYRIHAKVEEMRFRLLRKMGNQVKEICAFSYSTNYESVTTGDAIQCEGEPGPNNVTLHLSGMQMSDTGMYICKLDIMYPPPYRTTEGNGTLIYVSDLMSECAQSIEPPEFILDQRILLVVCLVMFLYSMFITAVLLCGKQRKKFTVGNYEKMLESDQGNGFSPYYIRVN
ncbi:hypothetical protein XENTR_v10024403 [Xenopus tropicalis]|uniref:Cytotoxic T-lymphocyte protein 4 n=1 Tax=Xenopus tropicalis TaxID=8364 RepID=A0A6I8RD47_XENTR|nr:cytotoxic T-lymphocyte protein 4 [Xenopus tropicalis]KAE8580369.1 hypothetical protein XENTR_v10024403 [Xenopus tropicalis]